VRLGRKGRGIGAPQVEDTPDRWVTPAGERETEERERWSRPRELLGQKGMGRCEKKRKG
jgi:hypothetical protein